MSGTGPSRAAYEAHRVVVAASLGLDLNGADDFDGPPAAWEALAPSGHAAWDAAAQAAIKHAVSASHDGCAAVIAGLETDRDAAREQRDGAYRERARLAAFAAACYPAVMLTDAAEPDWPIVFVDTPAGQLSWHIAATDTDLFHHVPSTAEPTWDGHTTEAKYERLADMTDRLARAGGLAGLVASAVAAAEPVAVVASRDSVAPELAAAMAETRQLRELVRDILASFGPSGSGHTARVGQVQIRKWTTRAGIENSDGAGSRNGNGESKAVAEAAGHFARTWKDTLPELPDSYTCTYTCAEASAAEGLYRALGDDATADSIIRAHAAYDEEGDQHYLGPRAGTAIATAVVQGARKYDGTDPDLPGGWLHEDGTPCPEYLAPDNGTRWWCTTHERYLKRPEAAAIASAGTEHLAQEQP